MDSGHIEASFRFAESVLISEVSGLKGVESSLERCPHFWSVFIDVRSSLVDILGGEEGVEVEVSRKEK